jgi:hypothetical protein
MLTCETQDVVCYSFVELKDATNLKFILSVGVNKQLVYNYNQSSFVRV